MRPLLKINGSETQAEFWTCVHRGLQGRVVEERALKEVRKSKWYRNGKRDKMVSVKRTETLI